jgi:hypothetical protein
MKESDYIACGWYTPDYAHWFEKLEYSLRTFGAPYDFWAVPKVAGGWERNTCRKAGFVLEFMDRYPEKTLILLDVDCIVTGDLSALIGLPCDIALYLHSQKKRRRINLVPATGHTVLNPTAKTRELVEAWERVSRNAEFGMQDQEALTFALTEVKGLRLQNIGETAGGVILHSQASLAHRKVNGRDRFRRNLFGWLPRIFTQAEPQEDTGLLFRP